MQSTKSFTSLVRTIFKIDHKMLLPAGPQEDGDEDEPADDDQLEEEGEHWEEQRGHHVADSYGALFNKLDCNLDPEEKNLVENLSFMIFLTSNLVLRKRRRMRTITRRMREMMKKTNQVMESSV